MEALEPIVNNLLTSLIMGVVTGGGSVVIVWAFFDN